MAKPQTIKLGGDEYVVLPKAEYLRLQEEARVPTDAVDALEYARGSLGKTLVAARKHAGLTQVELARLLGKSQPMVSGAENGTVSVSERYVKSVLQACKLPLDWKGPPRSKKKRAKKA